MFKLITISNIVIFTLLGCVNLHASDQIHFLRKSNTQSTHAFTVPDSVIQYLQLKPSDWSYRPLPTFATKPDASNVVLIIPKAKELPPIAFLETSNEWIRLNSEKSLGYLNDLLMFRFSSSLNENKFQVYIDNLSILYRGYRATALTDSFKAENDKIIPNLNVPRFTNWTNLDPSKVQLLRGLCGEKIQPNGKIIEIDINIINETGAAESWKIRGLNKRYFEIDSVEIKPLYPADTFGYPIDF